MDSTQNPHQFLAELLQVSRFSIERSWAMFQIICQMDYFSLEEKFQIIAQIFEHTTSEQVEQNPFTLDVMQVFFDLHKTATDWAAFYEIQPKECSQLILALGHELVAQWLPTILQNITGDAPAEVDPQHVAQVREEMWADYDDPLENMETDYQEWDDGDWEWDDGETTQNDSPEDFDEFDEDFDENFDEHDAPKNSLQRRFEQLQPEPLLNNWAFILRLPINDGWEYTLLSNSGFRNADDDNPKPSDLGTVLEKITTRTLHDEENILQDLCRRNHHLENVALLILEIDTPKINHTYQFSNEDYQIVLKQKKWAHIRGLDFYHHLEQEILWPGGYSVLEDTINWNQNQHHLKQSCQTLSGWSIIQKNVRGHIPEFRWYYNSQLSQKLDGSAEQESTLTMQNSVFVQLLSNQEWAAGTSATKKCIDIPIQGNRLPSSKHMCLLHPDSVVELLEHSLNFSKQSTPVFRKVQPIHEEDTYQIEGYGYSKALLMQICTEQSQQSHHQNSSLKHLAHQHNQITLKGSLLVQFGDTQNGLQLHFKPGHPFETVEETTLRPHQQTLKNGFGHITLYHNDTSTEWRFQQSLHIRPTVQESKSSLHIIREGGWTQHLESRTNTATQFMQKLTDENRRLHWSIEGKK